MNHRQYDASSTVEARELSRSKHHLIYPPTEKINVIEVDNFPQLGKVTALRFVEWVIKNPGGVIALPTGKTPEYFIRWVQRILEQWNSKEIETLLGAYGVESSRRPDMRSLTFIQVDEFFPMDARQHNSFHHYVTEFYIKGFGLDPAKALLIDASLLGVPEGKTMQEVFPDNTVDLTLRTRHIRSEHERLQKEVINRVDEWCMEYETKIRELGGIGFFLGGIGPDGHIAFNVRGSSIHSVTRLTPTNYETQAAAATDLGGIEISRNRLVITIGLATITYNPTATAIIMAAGEAKANVVAMAIGQKKSPQYPASVLQDLEHARFYLTHGAAHQLVERRFADFASKQVVSDEDADRVVISLALSRGKPLRKLTEADFALDRFSSELLRRTKSDCSTLADAAHRRLVGKIDRGLQHVSHTTFLHTEPHHDDIMLSYLAHIYHLVRDATNVHYFANLTSGFTSVTNVYVLLIVRKLKRYLDSGALSKLMGEDYFDPSNIANRMTDVYSYLDGVVGSNLEQQETAQSNRILRNMIELYRSSDVLTLKLRVRELEEYFERQYPGAKDPPDVQTLKGMLREFEVELIWAYFGIEASAIFPLRLGFYTGDIFTEQPEHDRDVVPIYELLTKLNPDVVTVAFDPESSGPDTHYKALQAVAAALKKYEVENGRSDIRVWGYRNVWYRFHPADVNLMVPVSLNSLSLLHTAFMDCFGSQRAASFPSHEHDGPFSELAQRIQVEQYWMAKTCLGDDFFHKNAHPRLRAAHGMIFLKEMTLSEFYTRVRAQRDVMEPMLPPYSTSRSTNRR